jgi:dTDP-4-amino-4,6-dideoxygalactose transaminase
VSLIEEQPDTYSNRWLTTILVDPKATGGVTREDIRQGLQAEDIESRPLWKPMHLQPVFKGAPVYVTGISEDLFNRGLCLPSGSNLPKEDLKFVTSAMLSMLT